MALPKDIKDKQSTTRRYGNVQAFTDAGTRDNAEDRYYRFKKALKDKKVSDADFEIIKKVYNNNEISAENAVLNKSAAELHGIVMNARMIPGNKVPKSFVGGSSNHYTDTGTGGGASSNSSGGTSISGGTSTSSTTSSGTTQTSSSTSNTQKEDDKDKITAAPPTKLPTVVKPSQQNPDRITDSGSGEYSKFREQKYLKNVSDEDFGWIYKAYNMNREEAENAVIEYSENVLRRMIEDKKKEAGATNSDYPQPNPTPYPSSTPTYISPTPAPTPGPSYGPEGAPTPNTDWMTEDNFWEKFKQKNEENARKLVEEAKLDLEYQLTLPEDQRYLGRNSLTQAQEQYLLDARKWVIESGGSSNILRPPYLPAGFPIYANDDTDLREKYLKMEELYLDDLESGKATSNVYFDESKTSLSVGPYPFSIFVEGGKTYVANFEKEWIGEYDSIGVGAGAYVNPFPIGVQFGNGEAFGVDDPIDYIHGFVGISSTDIPLFGNSLSGSADFSGDVTQEGNTFQLNYGGAVDYSYYDLKRVMYFDDKNGD